MVGSIVPFNVELGEISPVEASKYLVNRKQDECQVEHDHNNVEYILWVMALMFMSWCITNLKEKPKTDIVRISIIHMEIQIPDFVKKEQYFIKNFTMNVLKLSKIY